MPIVLRKERLRTGLFGRYFNTYFSDNMGNLTTPTNSDVQAQLSSYSVGTTDTWLFRGYFLSNTIIMVALIVRRLEPVRTFL